MEIIDNDRDAGRFSLLTPHRHNNIVLLLLRALAYYSNLQVRAAVQEVVLSVIRRLIAALALPITVVIAVALSVALRGLHCCGIVSQKKK